MANITTIDEHLIRIENAKKTLGEKARSMGLQYDGDSITEVDYIEDIAAAFDDIPVRTANDTTATGTKATLPAGYRKEDTEVNISTSGKTATATVDGKSISADVADGSFIATASDPTVQEAAVGANGTNITLTEVDSIPANPTGSYIEVNGGVSALVTATATINKAGYLEAGQSKTADGLVEVQAEPRYYQLNDGTVDVTGGGLSKGAGSAGATLTGANFSLTESTSQPASGKKYITATGSGNVHRAAIGYKTTKGVVGDATIDGEDLEENGLGQFGSASMSSNTATKYYTIPDTVADTASGTAHAAHIMEGQKAWVDGSEVTGTMPNKGAVETSVEILDKDGNTPSNWTLGNGYVSGVSLQFNYDILLNRLAKI